MGHEKDRRSIGCIRLARFLERNEMIRAEKKKRNAPANPNRHPTHESRVAQTVIYLHSWKLGHRSRFWSIATLHKLVLEMLSERNRRTISNTSQILRRNANCARAFAEVSGLPKPRHVTVYSCFNSEAPFRIRGSKISEANSELKVHDDGSKLFTCTVIEPMRV